MADDGDVCFLVEGEVDGFGWGVVQALNLVVLPTREHWLDEVFVARLFGLSRRGVKLDGLMAWAYFVAGENKIMLDCQEVLDHVQTLVDEHFASVQPEVVVVSPGAMGVAKILGPDLPTLSKWRDITWVRALLELEACGVELADFQAWCRDAAMRVNPIISDATDSDEVSLKTGIEECNHDRSASPESQEVDGPSPASKLKIVIEVGGELVGERKRKREEEMTVNVTAVYRTRPNATEEVASHSKNQTEGAEETGE